MSKFKLMSSKGFTIIELLIVVTIIGLLASVIIASVQDARRASRDARMISDLKQVQNALELFRNANNGLYPCIPPATPGGPTNPRIVTMTSGCSDLTPYMATLPTSLNPAHTGTNNDYLYRTRSAGDRSTYTILVLLYRNTSWCSINHGGLGHASWNGLNETTGAPDGSNYTPCF